MTMKIKALSLAFAMVAALAGVAKSEPKFRFPQSSQGDVAHPLYGGYSYLFKDDTAEEMVCTGNCVLAGVYISTGGVTTHLEIQDTDTADAAGTRALPYIGFSEDEDTKAHGNLVPAPLRSSNGFSARLSSVAQGESVTILYLDLDY